MHCVVAGCFSLRRWKEGQDRTDKDWNYPHTSLSTSLPHLPATTTTTTTTTTATCTCTCLAAPYYPRSLLLSFSFLLPSLLSFSCLLSTTCLPSLYYLPTTLPSPVLLFKKTRRKNRILDACALAAALFCRATHTL